MGNKDTVVEAGSLYEMKELGPFGKKIIGTMLATSVDAKSTTGLLQLLGYKSEVVIQGSDRMNGFKLIGRMTPVKGPGRPKKEDYKTK